MQGSCDVCFQDMWPQSSESLFQVQVSGFVGVCRGLPTSGMPNQTPVQLPGFRNSLVTKAETQKEFRAKCAVGTGFWKVCLKAVLIQVRKKAAGKSQHQTKYTLSSIQVTAEECIFSSWGPPYYSLGYMHSPLWEHAPAKRPIAASWNQMAGARTAAACCFFLFSEKSSVKKSRDVIWSRHGLFLDCKWRQKHLCFLQTIFFLACTADHYYELPRCILTGMTPWRENGSLIVESTVNMYKIKKEYKWPGSRISRSFSDTGKFLYDCFETKERKRDSILLKRHSPGSWTHNPKAYGFIHYLPTNKWTKILSSPLWIHESKSLSIWKKEKKIRGKLLEIESWSVKT